MFLRASALDAGAVVSCVIAVASVLVLALRVRHGAGARARAAVIDRGLVGGLVLLVLGTGDWRLLEFLGV